MRMSKCKDCEEITSLLIGMRNYYLLADFWTRTSPKYTNLVQTRHTTHWDLARNPHSQCAGGLTVGVKNGYDEVNIQMYIKKISENVFTKNKSSKKICFYKESCGENTSTKHRRKIRTRSPRSNRPAHELVAT